MRFLPSMRNFGNFYRDTIPSSLTTQTIGGNASSNEWYISSQYVTGINVPIQVDVRYSQDRVNLYYAIDYDSGGFAWLSGDGPDILGFELLNDGDYFTIYPNTYINFGVEFGADVDQSEWLRIRYGGSDLTIFGYCDILTST